MILSAITLFKGNAPPSAVTILIPDDSLLLSWTADHLRSLLLGSGEEAGINAETLSGPEVTSDDLLSLVKEKPLFGSKRLVWVTQAEKSPGLLEKKNLSELLSLARKGSTSIVLEMPEKKAGPLDETVPVYRVGLPAQPRQKHTELLEWIKLLGKKKGYCLDEGSAEILLRAFPEQFGQISSFLDRIPGQEDGKPRNVTTDDLKKLGLEDPLESVFRLFDAWEKNDPRFYGQWERFVENGQSPLGMLSLWHRQWRLYATARASLKTSSDLSAFSARNRIPLAVAEKIRSAAGKMTKETLRTGYSLLRKTDLCLKSGADPSLVMVRFFIGMSSLSPGKGGVSRKTIRTGR